MIFDESVEYAAYLSLQAAAPKAAAVNADDDIDIEKEARAGRVSLSYIPC
jgi:hypothetical protein